MNDIYLIKTDRNGNKLWEKTFGGNNSDYCTSGQETSDGGFIITGCSQSFHYDGDVYLIRTDAIGNTLWERNIGGGSSDWGESVQQTVDGGFIISGFTSSFAADQGNVYIVKTDEAGNTIWENIYGGDGLEAGNSIQQTVDGGFIVVGATTSFGSGKHDVYLFKTDANGKKLWEKTFGGSREDWGSYVLTTYDGGFIVMGYTSSLGEGNNGVYLIKTDANGTKLWEKTFGGSDPSLGYSVKQTSDGGLIITGSTFTQTNEEDVLLIKTDSEGNVK